MLRYLYHLFCLYILFFVFSCKQGDTKKASEIQKKDTISKNIVKLPVDTKWNDLSLFLAGLHARDSSQYKQIEKNQSWISYETRANTQWKDVIEKKLPIMQSFQKDSLKEFNQEGGTLFYPFSGPDFLHAITFFPKADTIVMIGLEPIGSVPDFEKIFQNSGGIYFNALQNSLESILGLSFFQTVNMQSELTGKNVAAIDGTLPLLMLFMSRMQQDVLYYQKMTLNSEGKLVKAADTIAKPKTDTSYYVTQLDFKSRADNKRKVLLYMGINLSDDVPYVGIKGMKYRPDILNFLKNLNIRYTYLKSASYQLHRPYFSVIRNLILDKSRYILQDDSGIPFQYLADPKWGLTLFGRYAGPIALFSMHYQKDMDEAFKNKKYAVKQLPFGIGYQHLKGNSNLIFAQKK